MTPVFDSPRALNALLLYGSEETRVALSDAVAAGPDPLVLDLLADTALSTEPWLLRARCLEVLGHVAAHSGRPVAEAILGRLMAPAHEPPQ